MVTTLLENITIVKCWRGEGVKRSVAPWAYLTPRQRLRKMGGFTF